MRERRTNAIVNSLVGMVLALGLVSVVVDAGQTGAAGQEAAGQSRFIRDIKPPFVFTITTTTPDGRLQPGITIHCVHPRPERGRALVDMTARTDDSGTARFTITDANLITDRYIWFRVADTNFAGSGRVGISPIDHEFAWAFKTLPLQERAVQVVDPQGKGVAGARVWLNGPDVFLDNPDVRSDSEGRIALKCPPGELVIGTVAPNFAPTAFTVTELPADSPYVIKLDRGRRIEGQILDASGKPGENLLVRARKEEPFHYLDEFIPKARSGKDGRFTMTNVAPGDWQISARSEDPNRPLFVAPITHVVTADADALGVALQATEGFRIKGRYVSRYNTRLVGMGGRHVIGILVDPPLRATWEEQTNEDGTFDIWGIPCQAAGSVNFMGISGFHEVVRMAQTRPFFRINDRNVRFENVPAGTYADVEVQFLLAGRVDGTVTDAAGQPMRGVEVLVKPSGYIFRCDEKGQFSGEIPPGEAATLTVRKRQDESKTAARLSPRGEEVLLVSESFTVQEGQIVEKRLVVGFVPSGAAVSTGQSTAASLASLDLDVKPETLAGRKVLLCFFDASQRPSRRFVQELAGRARALEENSLPLLLIHAGQTDKDAMREWLRESGVSFPSGIAAAPMPQLLRDWTVQALPWLVLLDESQAIQAAGFDLAQLDESLQNKAFDRLPVLLDWRAKFDRTYCLADGQILKRVAPPFIPERARYYAEEHKTQASFIADPPERFVFHWDGKLNNWGLSFGDKGTLGSALSFVLGLNSYEYTGPEDLLSLELPGDWIIRPEAPMDAKLAALERVLAGELGRKIRFVKRPVEQDVIVATGRFELHPLPEPFRQGGVTMYAGEPDPDSGGGGGTAGSVAEFLKAVGNQAGLPVIDKTEPGESKPIPYYHQRSSYLTRVTDPAEKTQKLKVLLENLSTQTNLQFNVESRTVEKWFATEVP